MVVGELYRSTAVYCYIALGFHQHIGSQVCRIRLCLCLIGGDICFKERVVVGSDFPSRGRIKTVCRVCAIIEAFRLSGLKCTVIALYTSCNACHIFCFFVLGCFRHTWISEKNGGSISVAPIEFFTVCIVAVVLYYARPGDRKLFHSRCQLRRTAFPFGLSGDRFIFAA